jgi:hypothetical protein
VGVNEARRANAHAAAAGNRNWLELRGTIAETRQQIPDYARAVAIPQLSLWESSTKIFELIDLMRAGYAPAGIEPAQHLSRCIGGRVKSGAGGRTRRHPTVT